MPTTTLSDLDPDTEALAQRWADAIQAGDMDGWGAQFSADGVCWHSYSGAEMSAAANTEMLRGMAAAGMGIHYDDVRRRSTRDGYVQQHRLTLTTATGDTYQTGACAVVHVSDGRITRMEEYLDSSILTFGR